MKRKKKYLSSFNLIIKNLDPTITKTHLENYFSEFGSILSCDIRKNKNSVGYIQYEEVSSASNAIKSRNGKYLGNQKIVIEYFKDKNERPFTNVYVKYIPKQLNKQALIELFEFKTNGKINSSKYWPNYHGNCACLNFTQYEHARLAVERMNGYYISHYLSDNDENLNHYELYVAKSDDKYERCGIKNYQHYQPY